MKKVLATLTSIGILAVPLIISAQGTTAPTVDVLQALDRTTNWLFVILLIVAAIFIIIAGYFFITAQGDPENIKKARNMVLYGVIGAMVGFLAKGLVILAQRMTQG